MQDAGKSVKDAAGRAARNFLTAVVTSIGRRYAELRKTHQPRREAQGGQS
jgi:hypothetical protein